MPSRKLSDIASAYRRSAEALEDAQERLTEAIHTAQEQVDAAAKAHFAESDALFRWLRAHADKAIIYGDYVYYLARGQIERREVAWSHNTWVEDPPAVEARLATAWGDVEPEASEVIVGSNRDKCASRAGNTGDWQEPNGQPIVAEATAEDCEYNVGD